MALSIFRSIWQCFFKLLLRRFSPQEFSLFIAPQNLRGESAKIYAKNSHIIKIASKIFRHNYYTWFCLKSALKRAKKRAISRLCDTSEPLQNRGSRVRVLPPLPNENPLSSRRRIFCLYYSFYIIQYSLFICFQRIFNEE